jgi:hypothetical protein
MNNLFEFVQALTLVDDVIRGVRFPVVTSKCYKNDNLKEFICDDCDCKEWDLCQK